MINSTEKSIPGGTETQFHCHLANNDHDISYYSGIIASVEAQNSDCTTECYSNCKICWTSDNCAPICSEDKDFTIDGFNPQAFECQRPFYFCNRGLTLYQYKVNIGTLNEETRVKPLISKYSKTFLENSNEIGLNSGKNYNLVTFFVFHFSWYL